MTAADTAGYSQAAYTVQQVAQLTGLSVSTIRAAYRSGNLTVHYVTARPVVLHADLLAWLSAAPTRLGAAS